MGSKNETRLDQYKELDGDNPLSLEAVTGYGSTRACGTTVPAIGTTGYSPGCFFQQLDATGQDDDSLFMNEGTKTSCKFRSIGAGEIDSRIVIDDDFIGDYPANATAMDGHGKYSWTKLETLGLGVISVDSANGILKFSFDNAAEAATAALYFVNAPVDINDNPIFECVLAIYDIGDDAALDINFGLATGSHADDADSIAESAFFHLDGNDLSLKCECDDGTNETAATDTTVDLADNTYYAFKIDASNLASVKFYYRAIASPQAAWTRLLSATTFNMVAATGTVTPIVHMEKTSNNTTADVRLDRIITRADRA